MRIREAEKLLGFPSDNPTAPAPPPPPTPWDSSAAVLSAAGLLCEINRSCSVKYLINLQSSSHQKHELEIANDKEDETDVARISSVDKEDEEKQEEREVEATGMMKCKKITGEEWQSKLKELSSYPALLGESISGNQRSVLEDGSDREALAEGFNGVEHEGFGGGNLCNFSYKKKRRPLKKRGRKPVKARSLKSLLSF